MKALRQRPWLFALAAGAGATLLLVGGLALLSPLDLLDRLAALGDRVLAAGAAGAWVVATLVARAWLRPGRFSDEELEAAARKSQAAAPGGERPAGKPHLR